MQTDEPFTISANITNIGNLDAENFTVTFSIDNADTTLKKEEINRLEAKATTTLILKWNATISNHTLIVTADMENHLIESDEHNNRDETILLPSEQDDDSGDDQQPMDTYTTTWREAESWDRSYDTNSGDEWDILSYSTASNEEYTRQQNMYYNGDYAEWDFTVYDPGIYYFWVRHWVDNNGCDEVILQWNGNTIGSDSWYQAIGGNYWEWTCFGTMTISEGPGTLRLESQVWRYMETDNIVITADPYFTPSETGDEGSTSHHIGENTPPYEPGNPLPADGSTAVSVYTMLSWTGGDPDGETVYYDVYLEADDSSPDVLVSEDQTSMSYTPSDRLDYDTQYYWQIVATDENEGTTSGSIWDFWTESPTVPSVLSDYVSMVGSTGATVHGKLLDDGNEPCDCYLTVVGEETHYCGEFTSGETFSYSFSGLEPGTPYQWYAYAENSAGSDQGEIKTFTTAPVIQLPDVCCLIVLDKGETWVILEAQLTDDGGEPCTCTLSITGGESWTEPGTHTAPHTFSHNFTGLNPDTEYRGNAKVENSCGSKMILTFFTTDEPANPDVIYDGHVVDDDYDGDSFGDGDGTVEGGETSELVMTLKNTGSTAANDIYAYLSTDDSLITVSDDYADYGTISAGTTATGEYVFEVDINHEGGEAVFTLEIHDGDGNSWTDTFTVYVYECTGLNYKYVREKAYVLSRVIFDAYDVGEIAKGRAFGTKGEQFAATQIENWMNDLSLDQVYIDGLDGAEACKLEVLGVPCMTID